MKSILVIDNNELRFLKDVTNQYRQSNLKPEYYSVVEKIRSEAIKQDKLTKIEEWARNTHMDDISRKMLFKIINR